MSTSYTSAGGEGLASGAKGGDGGEAAINAEDPTKAGDVPTATGTATGGAGGNSGTGAGAGDGGSNAAIGTGAPNSPAGMAWVQATGNANVTGTAVGGAGGVGGDGGVAGGAGGSGGVGGGAGAAGAGP